VNQKLLEFAKSHENCYFVTATQLSANPDGIHMNARSLRIFGYRYFMAFQKSEHILNPVAGEEKSLTAPKADSKNVQMYLAAKAMVLGSITYSDFEKQMKEIL
jgi:hypothetical protein